MRTAGSDGQAPVRVLHVLLLDTVGGTERVLTTMAERLQTSAVSTEVALLAAPGPVAARLRGRELPVWSLGRPLPLAAARLARLLRSRRYDVVNAYGLKGSLIARLLVRLVSAGSRFVVGVRGLVVTETEDESGFKARLAGTIERRTSRWVDAYDANSRGAIQVLVDAGIDRSRFEYIPNGIDTARWTPRKWNGGDEEVPLVVCVARFVPRKRQRDVVLALERLQRDGVRCRAAFGGDGPTLGDVRDLAARVGLGDSVQFLGRLTEEETRALLHQAEVFCLASRWEGMAGSVLEAMATGLPVVAARVNGIEELVMQERTGLLVPPGRPDLLAEALRRVLADRDLRRRLGLAGRQRVEAEFSLERMLDSKSRLYLALSGR